MAISSDRIVRKFFVAGYMDQMPGGLEGYDTFEEALEQADFLQQPQHSPGSGKPIYVFEAFVVVPPAS